MDKNLDFGIYSEKSRAVQNRFPKTAKLFLTRTLKDSSSQNQQNTYQTLTPMLFYNQHYLESLMSLKRICVLSPRDWGNWLNLITALLALGKYEQALSFLKKALIRNPNISNLHFNLLNVLQKLQRLNEAEGVYQEISAELKYNLLAAELYYKAGEVFLGSQKGSQALSYYKRAAEISPTKHIYSFRYGMALYHERLFKEALTQFEHCLRIDPNDKHSFNNIAFINYNLGNIGISLGNFKEILDQKLETHVTYSNLILIKFHFHGNDLFAELKKYKEKLRSYVISHGSQLRKMYNTELEFAQLEYKNGPDKQATTEKITSLNYILFVLRELQLTL